MPLEEVFRITGEEDSEPVGNPVQQVLREDQSVSLEDPVLLTAKDGRKRALAGSAAPIRNSAGAISRVVLVFRDQTEKQRREQLARIRTDLREYAENHPLNDLLSRAIEATGAMVDSPVGFFHFYDESSGKLTSHPWSTRTPMEFCKTEGHSAHPTVTPSRMWSDCVHLKSPVVHNEHASLANRQGLPPGHAELVRELVVPVLQAGKVVALLGVGNKPTDYDDKDTETVSLMAETIWAILERKMVITELEESENRFRRLHESLRDAYAQVDMTGRIVDFNSLFQEMLGYSGDELRQRTYRDVSPPEWHATETEILQNEVLTQGYSKVYEKYYQRKDGSTFPVELRAHLLTDQNGKPVGMWAIVRDITDRKLAEASLREAERTAKGTLNALPEHLAILDEAGTILDVNDAWRRFEEANHPLRPPVCEGANYFQACREATWADAETAKSFVEGIRSVMAGHRAEYVHEYTCLVQGSQHWFSGRVTRFAGEGPTRVVVAHEDITESKIAENVMLDALAEAERFKTAMDHLTTFVFIKDRNYRYVYGNRPTLNLFQCSAKELVGSDDSKFFPPETVARIRKVDRRVIESGEDTAEESISTGADGTRRVYWAVKTPVYDRGEIWGLCGIATDITDLKDATDLLQAKSELLDLAGTMAKVGGWEFDPLTLEGTWTDETARIHDLPDLHDLNARMGLEFYSEASAPKITKSVQEAIEYGKPYDLELELISAKGIHKSVRTVGNPIRDAQGKIIKIRGMIQDITEMKAAQAEMQHLLANADKSRQALLSLLEDQKASESEILRLNTDLEQRVEARTRELEEANHELEAFAYSVSHDLRAPLRHMEGFLSMLARYLGDKLDDKATHYLKVAQGASVRMGQLVEGLLSFSRLGRAEIRCLAVDTSALVASVIDESKSEWKDRQIRWEVGTLPVIQGDPTLLRLVFQNLLGNSLKFSRNRPETVIEVQPIEGMAGEVGISIRDNGTGFDPAYAHKLFGVFQRLHREEEFEGTGIGLANVHRIVTRHGGRVWAEGRLGEGATFFLAFPANKEPL